MASDGAGAHTTGTRAHDVAVGVASPYWMMAGTPLLRHLNTASQNSSR